MGSSPRPCDVLFLLPEIRTEAAPGLPISPGSGSDRLQERRFRTAVGHHLEPACPACRGTWFDLGSVLPAIRRQLAGGVVNDTSLDKPGLS